MARVLLLFLICCTAYGADKGVLGGSIFDFSAYCNGQAKLSDQHLDAPWWSGFCFVKQTAEGFQIQVNLRGPVQENFNGRTPVGITFRDDSIGLPLIFIEFQDWIGMQIIPNSQEVRDELIRMVARTGDRREAVFIRKTAAVSVRPSMYDNPEIHSLTIDVVGVEWPLPKLKHR